MASEKFIGIRLLTTQQIIEELGVSRITLWRWRTEGLPWVLLGRRSVRYRLTDIQEWLRSREVIVEPLRAA